MAVGQEEEGAEEGRRVGTDEEGAEVGIEEVGSEVG
jgi:hypothetical protein